MGCMSYGIQIFVGIQKYMCVWFSDVDTIMFIGGTLFYTGRHLMWIFCSYCMGAKSLAEVQKCMCIWFFDELTQIYTTGTLLYGCGHHNSWKCYVYRTGVHIPVGFQKYVCVCFLMRMQIFILCWWKP